MFLTLKYTSKSQHSVCTCGKLYFQLIPLDRIIHTKKYMKSDVQFFLFTSIRALFAVKSWWFHNINRHIVILHWKIIVDPINSNNRSSIKKIHARMKQVNQQQTNQKSFFLVQLVQAKEHDMSILFRNTLM